MTVRPEDLAHTLVARQRARREAARARAAELRQLVEDEVRAILGQGLARRAWLIGSLARGAHGARSDVDVVVEGASPEQVGALWARLVELLGAEVDLLRLEDLSESFRRRVLAEGVPFHVP